MRRVIADLDRSEPIRLAASLRAGKKVPPDATELLADDHRTVLGWFKWYATTPDPAVRERLVPRMLTALRAHMAAEEELLYPAIGRLEGGSGWEQRALAQHAGAKEIMHRIEQEADEPTTNDLVAKLEGELEEHIAEEEAELFPLVRRAALDLYELGSLVAARRVDIMLELRTRGASAREPAKEENPMMSISQTDAREYFVLGLKNAHATTRQGRVLIAGQVERLQSYPSLKAKLDTHLHEKDAQLKRLEALLSSCGESPSVLKDTAMSVGAGVAAVASAATADEVVKNSFATLAQAHYEAAAFETLIVFAQAAGEAAALRPLQQCLNESRGLASFVTENLRGTAVRFLKLRAEGRQAKR